MKILEKLSIDIQKIMENFYLLVISILKNPDHDYQNFFMDTVDTMPKTLLRKEVVWKMHWIQAVLFFLCLQITLAISSGLSDFYKMVVVITKVTFKKHYPLCNKIAVTFSIISVALGNTVS